MKIDMSDVMSDVGIRLISKKWINIAWTFELSLNDWMICVFLLPDPININVWENIRLYLLTYLHIYLFSITQNVAGSPFDGLQAK